MAKWQEWLMKRESQQGLKRKIAAAPTLFTSYALTCIDNAERLEVSFHCDQEGNPSAGAAMQHAPEKGKSYKLR